MREASIVRTLIAMFSFILTHSNAFAGAPQSIMVPYNAPIGTILAQWDDDANSLSDHNVDVQLSTSFQDSGLQTVINQRSAEVWRTANPGVGVAFEVIFDHGIEPVVFSDKSQHSVDAGPAGGNLYGARLHVLLVKIGLGTNQAVHIPYQVVNVRGDDDFGHDSIESDLEVISVTTPTCEIQTKDVTVNMGNGISISRFKKTGDKSDPVKFGVSMMCPAGINKVFYHLSPAGGSKIVGESSNGTISLSNQGGQGDASGVGVQIENGDPSRPIPLGQNLQITQYNPSQDNQQLQVDFTASYIQTDGNVKGGEADAKATYTLSYE
ncbi:Fimbrial protein [Burkholderia ambifaria IOP40-10]|uniref:Fimbrial protein n=1 Tax=Burkholderia ambifaria IOP40-10 TaxID=396596 RepID=B1FH38_9BURK|nr:fimbrial protein [Burkholderia ambifaria]EDT03122.1 Fimbrial protein [Burkholderia ambifaria IOP40-10]